MQGASYFPAKKPESGRCGFSAELRSALSCDQLSRKLLTKLGNDTRDRFLGIAKEHPCVFTKEKWIVDT